jgi:ammonia channel protein AmtB
VLAVIAWVTLLMVPYFWLMRYFNWARVPMEQELEGLDASKYHVITTNELPAQAAPQTKASFA